MANPTRFTSGVATVSSSDVLGQFPEPDPTKVITYFNDFHTYAAGDYTVTGSPTVAQIANTVGGALSITAANATDNTVSSLQLVAETFQIAAGKKAWFKCRLKQATAVEGDFLVGLHVLDTSPIASLPSDGLFFRKDDDDALIDISCRIDAAEATVSTGLATLVDDTYVVLGWYFDGVGTVYAYVDGVLKATLSLTAANLTAIDDEPLTLGISFQNGTTAAHVGSVDYVLASVER